MNLAKKGENIVEFLIHVLKNEDEDVKGGASWVLQEIKDKKAVRYLIQTLKDEYEYEYVRKVSALSLGNIRGGRAVEPLIQALKDENASVRSNVAEALENTGDKSAVEPLSRALNNNNGVIREYVEKALKKIR